MYNGAEQEDEEEKVTPLFINPPTLSIPLFFYLTPNNKNNRTKTKSWKLLSTFLPRKHPNKSFFPSKMKELSELNPQRRSKRNLNLRRFLSDPLPFFLQFLLSPLFSSLSLFPTSPSSPSPLSLSRSLSLLIPDCCSRRNGVGS